MSVRFAEWTLDGSRLRKRYVVSVEGLYLIAVRPYRSVGTGDYEIVATCTGGPCNREFPAADERLAPSDASHCISQARRCAFDRLGAYDGWVGSARAEALFTQCMGEALLSDGSAAIASATP